MGPFSSLLLTMAFASVVVSICVVVVGGGGGVVVGGGGGVIDAASGGESEPSLDSNDDLAVILFVPSFKSDLSVSDSALSLGGLNENNEPIQWSCYHTTSTKLCQQFTYEFGDVGPFVNILSVNCLSGDVLIVVCSVAFKLSSVLINSDGHRFISFALSSLGFVVCL